MPTYNTANVPITEWPALNECTTIFQLHNLYEAILARYHASGEFTGTVSVTNGSTAVTGVGTRFDEEITDPYHPGFPRAVQIGDDHTGSVNLSSVTDATNAVLSANWDRASVSGVKMYGKRRTGGGQSPVLWIRPEPPVGGLWRNIRAYRQAITNLLSVNNPFGNVSGSGFAGGFVDPETADPWWQGSSNIFTKSFGATNWRWKPTPAVLGNPENVVGHVIFHLNDMKAVLENLVWMGAPVTSDVDTDYGPWQYKAFGGTSPGVTTLWGIAHSGTNSPGQFPVYASETWISLAPHLVMDGATYTQGYRDAPADAVNHAFTLRNLESSISSPPFGPYTINLFGCNSKIAPPVAGGPGAMTFLGKIQSIQATAPPPAPRPTIDYHVKFTNFKKYYRIQHEWFWDASSPFGTPDVAPNGSSVVSDAWSRWIFHKRSFDPF